MSDAAGAPPLRVLLLSLEFLSPFSGNGQYSRCIVRGLKRAGAVVLVASGRPEGAPLAAQDAEALGHCAAPHGVLDIPLPTWGRLDRGCAWEAFGAGCAAAPAAARMAAFAPHVACCVDYHAGLAWRALARQLPQPPPPMVYLNFRLFCTSTALHAAPGPGDAGGVSDAAFYRAAERASMASAVRTVALCRQDALQLLALAAGLDPVSGARAPDEAAAGSGGGGGGGGSSDGGDGGGASRLPNMATLLPPLRSDVAALVQQHSQAAAPPPPPPAASLLPPLAPGHALLTSLVRLSPEKNALAVPALLQALQAAHPSALAALRLQPFFTGCGDGSAYAEEVKAAARALEPAPVLCSAFLGASDLGLALRAAALNVHPCLADAYGMTIVEAAAWGVPSLVSVVGSSSSSSSDGEGAAQQPPLPPPSALFEPIGRWGSCCTHVTLAPLGGSASGERLLALSRSLPPVGACDLLAPTPLDASAEQGVLAFDFGAPREAQAAALRPLLALAAARAQGGEGGAVERVARVARQRAVAWAEEQHGEALAALLARTAREGAGGAV
jgi:hypothetical protein